MTRCPTLAVWEATIIIEVKIDHDEEFRSDHPRKKMMRSRVSGNDLFCWARNANKEDNFERESLLSSSGGSGPFYQHESDPFQQVVGSVTPTFDSGSCFVPHSNTPETSSISIQKSQRLKLKHRSFFFKKEKWRVLQARCSAFCCARTAAWVHDAPNAHSFTCAALFFVQTSRERNVCLPTCARDAHTIRLVHVANPLRHRHASSPA